MGKPGRLIRSIPEFSAWRSIKIAPETAVPVTDRVLKIIDSRTFQRLRSIRQLSLADRVFPSATHTRFSHALGVYHNMLDYLRHLDAYPAFYQVFEVRDYLSLLLAGLLHDLGHYPCSHQLDAIPPFCDHESLTVALLEGDLRLEDEDFSGLIRETFGFDGRLITRFIKPVYQLQPKYRVLKQLIDSPLDADKCDYLPRDSYFCGVDFGTGFDRNRFIGNLMPTLDGQGLCIHEKGLVSAERFQLARYWMYRSVYWGHTVRSFITMLSKACEYLPSLEDGPAWKAQLLKFHDNNFLEWLAQRTDQPGVELIERVHKRRAPYKRLFTLSFNHEPELYHALMNAPVETDWHKRLSSRLGPGGLRTAPHHLILDFPPRYKSRGWESFPVRVNEKREVPIESESPVIQALGPAFLHGVRKIRLFCHPDVLDGLDLGAIDSGVLNELLHTPDSRGPR